MFELVASLPRQKVPGEQNASERDLSRISKSLPDHNIYELNPVTD